MDRLQEHKEIPWQINEAIFSSNHTRPSIFFQPLSQLSLVIILMLLIMHSYLTEMTGTFWLARWCHLVTLWGDCCTPGVVTPRPLATKPQRTGKKETKFIQVNPRTRCILSFLPLFPFVIHSLFRDHFHFACTWHRQTFFNSNAKDYTSTNRIDIPRYMGAHKRDGQQDVYALRSPFFPTHPPHDRQTDWLTSWFPFSPISFSNHGKIPLPSNILCTTFVFLYLVWIFRIFRNIYTLTETIKLPFSTEIMKRQHEWSDHHVVDYSTTDLRKRARNMEMKSQKECCNFPKRKWKRWSNKIPQSVTLLFTHIKQSRHLEKCIENENWNNASQTQQSGGK